MFNDAIVSHTVIVQNTLALAAMVAVGFGNKVSRENHVCMKKTCWPPFMNLRDHLRELITLTTFTPAMFRDKDIHVQ